MNKKGIIERFNRTIWGYIKKYTAANNTLKYYDILPQLIKNYNNSYHRTIKNKPIKIFTNKINPIKVKVSNIDNDFSEGDKVRKILKRKQFDKKSYEPIYSTQVYEIIKKTGNKYIIKNNKTGKTSNIKYLSNELLKVNDHQEMNKFQKLKTKNNIENIKKNRMRRENIKLWNPENFIVTNKRISKPVKRLTY